MNIKNINWTEISVLVTMVGLLFTWAKNILDDRNKKSQFYLEQIKVYLSRAVALLSEKDNNNLQWHQAIENLKTADSLRNELTIKAHKNICVADYFDAAYCIVNVIKKIDDYKFFYGISDYKNKNSEELYSESSFGSLTNKYLRIAPEALLSLCIFIDKVNKGHHEITAKTSTRKRVFDSSYFKKSITELNEVGEFTQITMKIIMEYIKDFERNQSRAQLCSEYSVFKAKTFS